LPLVNLNERIWKVASENLLAQNRRLPIFRRQKLIAIRRKFIRYLQQSNEFSLRLNYFNR